MGGVLDGIKVIEFTHMVAGPACGQVLADLGADVVKVEPPQGDVTRRLGPKMGTDSALYVSTNRSKSVVVLDITQPDDAAEAAALAGASDVVVTNIDGGLRQRAGLDAATLQARTPGLIYVDITGFGPGGPAGTDGLAQAAMGMMAATGDADGPAYRSGPSVVDVSTGIWGALGVLAALENRRQTGKGDLVHASLADTCLYMQYPQVAMHGADPSLMRRRGNHSLVSCTPMLEASDGRIMLTVLHDRHWAALCNEIGRPDLIDRPEFATNAERCARQSELEAVLSPLTRQDTRQAWVKRLRALKLPCAPERSYAEIEADRELFERGMLFRLPDGTDGSLQVAMPLSFAATPIATPRPAPTLPRREEPR